MPIWLDDVNLLTPWSGSVLEYASWIPRQLPLSWSPPAPARRNSLEAAKSVVDMLDAGQQSLEELTSAPAGMGANVDIRV